MSFLESHRWCTACYLSCRDTRMKCVSPSCDSHVGKGGSEQISSVKSSL